MKTTQSQFTAEDGRIEAMLVLRGVFDTCHEQARLTGAHSVPSLLAEQIFDLLSGDPRPEGGAFDAGFTECIMNVICWYAWRGHLELASELCAKQTPERADSRGLMQ